MTANKREEQLARELRAIERAKAAFWAEVRPSNDRRININGDPVMLRVYRTHIVPFAKAIAAEFPTDAMKFSKRHRSWPPDTKQRIRELFTVVESEEAAAVVLQYTLRHCYINERKYSYVAICRPVADAVIQQYNYRRFMETLPYYGRVVKQNQSSNPEHLTAVFKHLVKKHNTLVIRLDDRERFIVGATLVQTLIDSTGLFTFREVTGPNGRPARIFGPTKTFVEELANLYTFAAEHLRPIDAPMICEPEPWTGLYRGGFLTNSPTLAHRAIVRTFYRDLRKNALERIPSAVLEALNRLQKVPWAINGWILDTLKAAKQGTRDLGGVPIKPLVLRLDEASGPPPWQIRGLTREEYRGIMRANQAYADEFLEWKRSRAREYDRWADEASKRAMLHTQMAVAEELRNEPAIYFCYSMDWRGRVYVQQNCGIDPQNNDIGRALLQFAEGKPLGERGLFWLKVHAANCYGYDKVSFNERVAFIESRLDDIFRCACEPLEHTSWTEADKPWMFLAACRELYLAHNNPSFLSHLPVSMDATCSGSQHFSALLRDPVGAYATNLIPGDAPRDIYTLVADEAAALMRGDPLGEVWLNVRGGWGRKWTKRNTMTFPYSAKLYGFQDQLFEEVREENRNGLLFPVPEGVDKTQTRWELQLCQYLARINRAAIANVVVKMTEAMNWLREVAKIIGKTGRDISWTTPIGLKVVQRYRKADTKQLDLIVGSVRYQARLAVETTKPNTEGHRNGISPNLIHSLDAAHLMKVVLAFDGALGVVHDSFSTHACDVDRMRDVIRKTFVEMYNTNLLGDLYHELRTTNRGLKLPRPPKQGNLDVTVVLHSEYFIS